MRVYIVGSVPRDPPPDDQGQSFSKCCSELGYYLASKDAHFVLGSISSHTAEFNVIQGIKKYIEANKGTKIHISFIMRDYMSEKSPDGQSEIEAMLPKESFNIKKIKVRGRNNNGRLIAGIGFSDVVLLLGGGVGTFTTGIASLAMQHPTLALPQLNGAAEQTWQTLLPHYARGPFTQADLDQISDNWNDDLPRRIFDALDKIYKNNPFKKNLDTSLIVLTVSSLACVIGWLVLFTASDKLDLPRYLPFLVIVGIATTLGSTTRNLIISYFTLEAKFSLSRFLTEFALGIIMSFISFLLIQFGSVVVEGHSIKLEMNGDEFARLAIVMSLIGFTTSFLIETSLDKVRSKLTGVNESAW